MIREYFIFTENFKSALSKELILEDQELYYE
jgi:hypothetical protein